MSAPVALGGMGLAWARERALFFACAAGVVAHGILQFVEAEAMDARAAGPESEQAQSAQGAGDGIGAGDGAMLRAMVVRPLPAARFVDDPLNALAMRPGRAGAVAGSGDGGPWARPTRAEFPAGGQEVDFAFCAPETDDLLRGAIASRLP